MSQLTEVLWGTVNIFPTLVLAIALYVAPSFTDYDRGGMIAKTVALAMYRMYMLFVNRPNKSKLNSARYFYGQSCMGPENMKQPGIRW